MDNPHLFICPNCKRFHSGIKGKEYTCRECHTKLEYVSINYDHYSRLTPELQEDLRARYLKSYSKNHADTVSNDPTSTSISILEIITAIALVGIIFLTIVLLTEEETVSAISLFLIGIMSCSAIYVYTGIAKDIKAIRRSIEKHK